MTEMVDFADSGDRWPFLAETGGQAIEGTSSIARLTLAARGQNPPGIRAAMHPRWSASLT